MANTTKVAHTAAHIGAQRPRAKKRVENLVNLGGTNVPDGTKREDAGFTTPPLPQLYKSHDDPPAEAVAGERQLNLRRQGARRLSYMQVEGIRPKKKRGFWLYRRRVPQEFRAYDKRKWVSLSTGIAIADDPHGVAARKKILSLHEATEKFWKDRASGIDVAAIERYENAVSLCHKSGFEYRTCDVLMAAASADDIADRVLAAMKDFPKLEMLHATMGGQEIPGVAVSALPGMVAELKAADHMTKSPSQKIRWRRPRDRAIETFIEVIGGDRPVSKLHQRDVKALREFWQERVLNGEVRINTANKNIRHVASMFRLVNRVEQWDLRDIFQHAEIEGGKDGSRVKFETAFIQDMILADGMFAGVNSEARGILYLMVETGVRPSEACALMEKDIVLDANIPFIEVRDQLDHEDGDKNHRLKNESSTRKIPLVGVSLMAMQANPKGFPRYLDAADSLSAILNKALTARNLRPVKGQSLYSLRHSFSDRLLVAGVAEPVKKDLMGHTHEEGFKYGDTGGLAFKKKCIELIMLRPPSTV